MSGPTLFYAPGACSLAVHIALEVIGAPFDLHRVKLSEGEHLTEAFKAINPKARVPALRLPDGAVITECVAILSYLARMHPEAALTPQDPVRYGKMMELLVWLNGTVHGAGFASQFRPGRFANDPAAQAAVKAKGGQDLVDNLDEIEAACAHRTWADGPGLTLADAYLIVLHGWAERLGVTSAEVRPHWARLVAGFRDTAPVRRALVSEGLLEAA